MAWGRPWQVSFYFQVYSHLLWDMPDSIITKHILCVLDRLCDQISQHMWSITCRAGYYKLAVSWCLDKPAITPDTETGLDFWFRPNPLLKMHVLPSKLAPQGTLQRSLWRGRNTNRHPPDEGIKLAGWPGKIADGVLAISRIIALGKYYLQETPVLVKSYVTPPLLLTTISTQIDLKTQTLNHRLKQSRNLVLRFQWNWSVARLTLSLLPPKLLALLDVGTNCIPKIQIPCQIYLLSRKLLNRLTQCSG